jgi:hypothetical protein
MPINKTDMIAFLLRLPASDHEPELVRLVRAAGLRSIINCRAAATQLFEKIEEHHGEKEARRIFARLGRPPSKRESSDVKNRRLLLHIAGMPERNIHKLAIRLSGKKDPAGMEKHLHRLLKQWNGK